MNGSKGKIKVLISSYIFIIIKKNDFVTVRHIWAIYKAGAVRGIPVERSGSEDLSSSYL